MAKTMAKTATAKPPKGVSLVRVDLCKTWVQGADCCSRDEQALTLRTVDGGGGPFLVLETERWALEDGNDLAWLVDEAKRMLGSVNEGVESGEVTVKKGDEDAD